jgi:hypothetical protein
MRLNNFFQILKGPRAAGDGINKMEKVPIYMDNKKYSEISKRIYESFPNACILYIDEVVNDNLLLQFENKKKEIGKVLQLFHGTHNELIDIIAENGFDPTKNRTSAFGYGTYFALNAKYSFSYMKSNEEITYMFLADVLIGKLATKKPKGTTGWDNNVDNLNSPTIYTTPYPDGAYPRYIIAFHKNAK